MKAAGNETVETHYSWEVIWDRRALEMARYFVKKCTALECQWFHFMDKSVDDKNKKITYWITEMLIPDQMVTGATVEADGQMMLKLAMEIRERHGLMVRDEKNNLVAPTDEAGERIAPSDEAIEKSNADVSRLAVWCHSHVQMACIPSTTDNEQWQDWITRKITDEHPNQPVMMVIFNQRDEYFCRLYDPQLGAQIVNAAFTIFDGIDEGYVDEALKNRVKKREYQSTYSSNNKTGFQSNQGNGGSSHQGNAGGVRTGQPNPQSATQGNPQGGGTTQLASTMTTPTSSTGSALPSSAHSSKFPITYTAAAYRKIDAAADRLHSTYNCKDAARDYIKILEDWVDDTGVPYFIVSQLLFNSDAKVQLADLFQIDDHDVSTRDFYAGAKEDLLGDLTSKDAPCKEAYACAAEIAVVYSFAKRLQGDAAGEYQAEWDALLARAAEDKAEMAAARDEWRKNNPGVADEVA